MKLVLVAAVAENGIIGDDGDIPWYYPTDLRHFKRTTLGHPVIMGRNTYESIVNRLGGPLPDRLNIVLSSQSLEMPDGAIRASGVDEAIRLAYDTGTTSAYVIGGESVYEQLIDRADRIILTEIHATYEGDTFFPERDPSAWTEVEREDRGELSFVIYERARG